MGWTAKILIPVVIGVLINTGFLLGQNSYYQKIVQTTLNQAPVLAKISLSSKLLNSADQRLILATEDQRFAVEPSELKNWIESYQRRYTSSREYRPNYKNIEKYLLVLSSKVNAPPVNGKFVLEDGKIQEFTPAQAGKMLNTPGTLVNIVSALAQVKQTPGNKPTIAELEIDEIEPEVTSEKANNLGINNLLARGESNFAGSPQFRAHNIGIGSKVFSGVLLKSGEEFSFNKLLGKVDAATGYQQELVIKNGTLIPEYGGGLCQVSTTLFRAAAAAGLPILERHPHSLPVRYYNPQGFDATIYPGVSDLRFKNDTQAYILIQSKIVNSKIYFEIYGTKDNRKVVIDGPHQYDIQPDGAMKAVLTRTVTYPDGKEIKDTFRSNYKSPSLFPTVRNPLE